MEIQSEHLGELVRRMRAAGVEPPQGIGTSDGKGVHTFNAAGDKKVRLSAGAQAIVDAFVAEGPQPNPRLVKADRLATKLGLDAEGAQDLKDLVGLR